MTSRQQQNSRQRTQNGRTPEENRGATRQTAGAAPRSRATMADSQGYVADRTPTGGGRSIPPSQAGQSQRPPASQGGRSQRPSASQAARSQPPPSQAARSQPPGSNAGSKLGSYYEDDEEDDDYYYDEPDVQTDNYNPPDLEHRAQEYEYLVKPCDCFPDTSSRRVPSMKYDNVKCPHVQKKYNVPGLPHKDVRYFTDSWGPKRYSRLPDHTEIEVPYKKQSDYERAHLLVPAKEYFRKAPPVTDDEWIKSRGRTGVAGSRLPTGARSQGRQRVQEEEEAEDGEEGSLYADHFRLPIQDGDEFEAEYDKDGKPVYSNVAQPKTRRAGFISQQKPRYFRATASRPPGSQYSEFPEGSRGQSRASSQATVEHTETRDFIKARLEQTHYRRQLNRGTYFDPDKQQLVTYHLDRDKKTENFRHDGKLTQ